MPTPSKKTPAAARRLDLTEHYGVIKSGSEDVSINSLEAARVGDYHACPRNTDGWAHVGGFIGSGSKSVSINGRDAARVGDTMRCDGSEDPKTKAKPSAAEEEAEEVLAECLRKALLNPLDFDCSGSLYEKAVSKKGEYGTATAQFTILGWEIGSKVGASYDKAKNEGFAGAQVKGGGAALKGSIKLESETFRIPGTNYGVSVSGDGSFSVFSLEGALGLLAIFSPKGFEVKGREGVAPLAGPSLEVAVAFKTMAPDPNSEELIDRIKEGSPDVFIGD